MTKFFKTEKTGDVHFRHKETSVQMTIDGNKPIVFVKQKESQHLCNSKESGPK